jgi:hypothetical protein
MDRKPTQTDCLKLLNYILTKNKMKVWTGYTWFRIGTSDGVCTHDSGFLGST